MKSEIEKDLWRCLNMMNPEWSMQNNAGDKKTNYIYWIDKLDNLINKANIEGDELNYVLHRWFNYQTSIECENIFCEYGARHEADKYNHDVDVWIDGQPFDVKLTRMPKGYIESSVKSDRGNRNELIKMLYNKRSGGKRMQAVRRLYVVCDGGSDYDNLRMKLNFEEMRRKIGAYMNYVRNRNWEFNRVDIELPNGEEVKMVRTDAIVLRER